MSIMVPRFHIPRRLAAHCAALGRELNVVNRTLALTGRGMKAAFSPSGTIELVERKTIMTVPLAAAFHRGGLLGVSLNVLPAMSTEEYSAHLDRILGGFAFLGTADDADAQLFGLGLLQGVFHPQGLLRACPVVTRFHIADPVSDSASSRLLLQLSGDSTIPIDVAQGVRS